LIRRAHIPREFICTICLANDAAKHRPPAPLGSVGIERFTEPSGPSGVLSLSAEQTVRMTKRRRPGRHRSSGTLARPKARSHRRLLHRTMNESSRPATRAFPSGRCDGRGDRRRRFLAGCVQQQLRGSVQHQWVVEVPSTVASAENPAICSGIAPMTTCWLPTTGRETGWAASS